MSSAAITVALNVADQRRGPAAPAACACCSPRLMPRAA
jgi:hypothetical protein